MHILSVYTYTCYVSLVVGSRYIVEKRLISGMLTLEFEFVHMGNRHCECNDTRT